MHLRYFVDDGTPAVVAGETVVSRDLDGSWVVGKSKSLLEADWRDAPEVSRDELAKMFPDANLDEAERLLGLDANARSSRPASSATSAKPYHLTPSEIESLRQERKKISEAVDEYYRKKEAAAKSKPYHLTPDEIESLRQERKKMTEVAEEYFRNKETAAKEGG